MRNTILSFAAILAVVTLSVTVQVVGQGFPPFSISICFEVCEPVECTFAGIGAGYDSCAFAGTETTCGQGRSCDQDRGDVSTDNHTALAFGHGAPNAAVRKISGTCGQLYRRSGTCMWNGGAGRCSCYTPIGTPFRPVDGRTADRYECVSCDEDEPDAPFEPEP